MPPPMVIYRGQGLYRRRYDEDVDTAFAHSDKGFTTDELALQYRTTLTPGRRAVLMANPESSLLMKHILKLNVQRALSGVLETSGLSAAQAQRLAAGLQDPTEWQPHQPGSLLFAQVRTFRSGDPEKVKECDRMWAELSGGVDDLYCIVVEQQRLNSEVIPDRGEAVV
ncbi:hypothetical protein FN846DRAFT_914129 [Sphaerosporella brunnea]|uniref:Uncharacterized protein n=1 Tax=Sphaerosporella brunnea TaxID=1250544 RepID=A0A5J5EEG2_9PEZI|nr:hypothetical protein FN846DRAFT_914129 [Sphaerosporella brunnea]